MAENFKGGALARMGLGYDDIAAVHPSVVYVSVSGFGNTVETPYDGWPAYAAVAEAMSGIYDYKLEPGRPPVVSPVGALGDIGTALFATIGLLAALRHRDRTGEGQYVDVAMFDAMVAMTDLVTNFWSLGLRPEPGQGLAMILDGFEAANGWFIIQVGREHEFERLANLVGKPEWLSDERLADPSRVAGAHGRRAPPGGERLGRRQDQHRGLPGPRRRRRRGRALPHRPAGHRGPPRRRAQHARRDPPTRRR